MSNIEDLERIFDEIIKKVQNIGIIPYDKKILIIMAYFNKIMESSNAIIILLKSGKLKSPTMTILRSMLEAKIDLDNIINIDGYIEYLQYMGVEQRIFLGNKEYFKSLSDGNECDYKERTLDLQKEKRELKEYLEKKYKKVFFDKKGEINSNIKFKFELSNNLDIYDTLYWLLCTETHNNILSIERNYIKKIDGTFNINLFQVMSEEEKNKIIETIKMILKDSINKIENILKER